MFLELENKYLVGWGVTSISTVCGGISDLLRKKVLNKGINLWDSLAIVNFLGVIYTLIACILTNAFPDKIEMNTIIACISSSMIKIAQLKHNQIIHNQNITFIIISKVLKHATIWQLNFQQILENYFICRSPLSTIIPILSWNSMFLLLSGYLFLDEIPNYLVNLLIQLYGIFGCVLILIGSYIQAHDKKSQAKNNNEEYHNFSIFGIQLKLSGTFYMIIVCILWTYSSTQEKYMMVNMNLTPSFLLCLQRVFMSIPLVLVRLIIFPKVFKATVREHFKGFIEVSLFENLATLLHFKGMKLLYVSYVTAFKRAGNIIISTYLGYRFLSEQISRLCLVSNFIMSLGIVAILLGK